MFFNCKLYQHFQKNFTYFYFLQRTLNILCTYFSISTSVNFSLAYTFMKTITTVCIKQRFQCIRYLLILTNQTNIPYTRMVTTLKKTYLLHNFLSIAQTKVVKISITTMNFLLTRLEFNFKVHLTQ